MRSSKTGRKTSSVARNAVLLKPNVANILRFSFYKQKFIQHGPITAIDCSEEKFSQKNCPIIHLDQNPHETVTRFGCVGFSIYANAYIPAKIKMNFIWKDVFFAKIGIFCKSTAGPLPSVVQAYTQLYSFGGRIKLIFCQLRRELSEIRTSWKKNVRWRVLYKA